MLRSFISADIHASEAIFRGPFSEKLFETRVSLGTFSSFKELFLGSSIFSKGNLSSGTLLLGAETSLSLLLVAVLPSLPSAQIGMKVSGNSGVAVLLVEAEG